MRVQHFNSCSWGYFASVERICSKERFDRRELFFVLGLVLMGKVRDRIRWAVSAAQTRRLDPPWRENINGSEPGV